jgi:hypothetical protein
LMRFELNQWLPYEKFASFVKTDKFLGSQFGDIYAVLDHKIEK